MPVWKRRRVLELTCIRYHELKFLGLNIVNMKCMQHTHHALADLLHGKP